MKTADRIKQLVHEGNIRRVVVTREGRTVAQFPLTVGVVGAVLAPPLAVLAALVALVTRTNVRIEMVDAPPEG